MQASVTSAATIRIRRWPRKQRRLAFDTSATLRKSTSEPAADGSDLAADNNSNEVVLQACAEKDAEIMLLLGHDGASPSAALCAGFTEIIGDGLNQATSCYVH